MDPGHSHMLLQRPSADGLETQTQEQILFPSGHLPPSLHAQHLSRSRPPSRTDSKLSHPHPPPPPTYAQSSHDYSASILTSTSTLRHPFAVDTSSSSSSSSPPLLPPPPPPPPPPPSSSFSSSSSSSPLSSSSSSSHSSSAPTHSISPHSNVAPPELPPIQPDAAPDHQRLPSLATLTGAVPSQLYPHPHPHQHPRQYSQSHSQPSQLLPPISSLAQQQHQPPSDHLHKHPAALSQRWPLVDPLTSYQHALANGQIQAQFVPASAVDSPGSRMDHPERAHAVNSLTPPTRTYDVRANSLSLDDPDVRLAAEALGDLRADLLPAKRQGSYSTTSTSHDSMGGSTALASSSSTLASRSEPPIEPLLNLITTQVPVIGKAVHNATAVYMSGKNTLPAHWKSRADYVEGYVTNTVGNITRATGVESGLRIMLTPRGKKACAVRDPEADAESAAAPSKRRRIDTEDDEHHRGRTGAVDPNPAKNRRLSSTSTVDTLPAYDELSSPAYSETADTDRHSARSSGNNAAWQSRLIMSTSGLSVAMSEESLRSLKYCLNWLRWANGSLGKTIQALKSTLEQYETSEQTQAARAGSDEEMMVDEEAQQQQQQQQQQQPAVAAAAAAATSLASDFQTATATDKSKLAAEIDRLRGEVLKTLKDAIETVSKYAGGALPENARLLVRRHLTSLPQRFRVATILNNPNPAHAIRGHAAGEGSVVAEKEVKDGAHRVLVLAKEGLEMVSQVTAVVDGTIVSAEEWCERLGRRVSGNGGQQGSSYPGQEQQQQQQLCNVGLHPEVKSEEQWPGLANGGSEDVKMG